MQDKLRRNIGFTMLPFAFIFLFDPLFALKDYLPDFIGYTILCIALINLSDINHRIADAVSGFKKGIVISLLRYVAVYMLKNVFSIDELYADNESSVGTLLFAFIFAFFELIILIPAYKNLFDGLLSLGMMHNGSYVYKKRIRRRIETDPESGKKIMYVREGRRNTSEKTFTLTVIFLLIHCIGYSMPEATSLTNNSSYEFIMLLRGFAFILTLPISIVWLVNIIKYFVGVRKDTTFIQELSSLYLQNLKERPNLHTVRIISAALLVMIGAFAVSLDFYIDYINVIPNATFFLGIIVAAFMLRKYSKKWIPITITSALGAAASMFTRNIAVKLYSDPNFSPVAIKKDIDAYFGYYKVVSFTILDTAFMMLTVILSLLIVWDVYKNHSNLAIATEKNEKKEYSWRFWRGGIGFLLSAFISLGGGIYYIMTQPYENVSQWYFYYAPIIAIFFSLMFALMAIYFIVFILNCVKYRYHMEL